LARALPRFAAICHLVLLKERISIETSETLDIFTVVLQISPEMLVRVAAFG